MAGHSHDGAQQTLWHRGYPPPASFPVAARQRPCDTQDYAFSRASYTNYGYVTTIQPPATHAPNYTLSPPHISVAPTREAEFQAWAAQRVEHTNRLALWAEQCEAGLIQQFGGSGHQRVAARSPNTTPCLSEAHATSPTTAGATRAPGQAGNGEEEAARQSLPAAAPPPRPARSIARSRPPPIPPPSTRPRVGTKTSNARLEDREAEAASSAATWQEPVLTPARPPPPPARSAARSKVALPREGTLAGTPSRATASLGKPDRTSPTNDQHISSSTPTTTAPSTRPILSPTTKVLPSRPPLLYGPRAPPTDLDRRGIINNNDLPRHVVRPRAIEEHGVEGGEKMERTRVSRGADALARSVRGTQLPALKRADHEFSRVFASPRTTGAFPRAITTAANTAERDKLRATLSAPQQGTDRPEQDRAISTPSPPVSSASGTTTRKPNDYPNPTVPSYLPLLSFAMPPPPSSAPPPLPSDARQETDMRAPCRTARPAMFGTTSVTTASHARDATDAISRPSCPPPPAHPAARPAPTPTRRDSTPNVSLQTVARDFSRDRTPLRAGWTSTPEISAPAIVNEGDHRSRRERAAPVPAPPPPPHIDARCKGQASSTPLAPPSSQPDSPFAAHPRQFSLKPPPRPIVQPPPSCLAPLKHPTPPTHPVALELGTRAALLADSRTYKEYTSADSVRLARAPDVAHVMHSAAPLANAGTLYMDRHCQDTPSLAPLVAYSTLPACWRAPHDALATADMLIHATKHPPLTYHMPLHPPPPPLAPPSSTLHPPSQIPPTPQGWPFPISVTEMGWVLTAVVMAQHMDREDEQHRCDEVSEDGDSFVFEQDEMHTYEADPSHEFGGDSNDEHPDLSPHSDEHASDAGMTSFVESTPRSLRHGSPISNNSDFDTAITRDWQEDEYYPSDINNSASPVSPPAVLADVEHSDGDSQAWEEPSAPLDESGGDFMDYDELE